MDEEPLATGPPYHRTDQKNDVPTGYCCLARLLGPSSHATRARSKIE